MDYEMRIIVSSMRTRDNVENEETVTRISMRALSIECACL